MEQWKSIKGYEGIYEISSNGRVKSLKFGMEKYLNPTLNNKGYYHITLYLNSKRKNLKIHQLVAISFLNHIPCGMELVVNHKDFNTLNNDINNLEIVTQRVNSDKKHIKSISQYTGVVLDKRRNKWYAKAYLNKKHIHLGSFKCEKEASNCYQNWLYNNIK